MNKLFRRCISVALVAVMSFAMCISALALEEESPIVINTDSEEYGNDVAQIPKEIIAPDGTIFKLETTQVVIPELAKGVSARSLSESTSSTYKTHDITSSNGLWCGYRYEIRWMWSRVGSPYSEITYHYVNVNPSSSRAVYASASRSGNRSSVSYSDNATGRTLKVYNYTVSTSGYLYESVYTR